MGVAKKDEMLNLHQKDRDGFALAAIRESRGWTQEQLSKATGLDQTQISHFECGRRRPSFSNLEKLARALNVRVDDLMGKATPVDLSATMQATLSKLSFDEIDLVEHFAVMLLARKRSK